MELSCVSVGKNIESYMYEEVVIVNVLTGFVLLGILLL